MRESFQALPQDGIWRLLEDLAAILTTIARQFALDPISFTETQGGFYESHACSRDYEATGL